VLINGYTFAGSTLSIKSIGSRGRSPTSGGSFVFKSKKSEEVKKKLTDILSRRYNAEQKFLDLSNLVLEPELKELGVTDMAKHQNIFSVLMVICDETFRTPKDKVEAVVSISIANNNLSRVGPAREVSNTFPGLKNLDLSNNQISSIGDLLPFRHKFKHLEHIILTGNPIETKVPQYKKEIIRMYPALQLINTVQLTPEELEDARTKKIPVPTKPGFVVETGNIAEDFIKTFFQGYDTDRKGLAAYYYDDKSKFSLDVNTSALRDPSVVMEKQDWEAYIRLSRNLNKITHTNARMTRLHEGSGDIAKLLESLPPTQHPSLETERNKWLIEIVNIPALPDPTGQHPGGVNGLCITLHGEFKELASGFSAQTTKQRSFDRTICLGPGGPNNVRIVSDLLVLRAYGGIQAFQSEVPMSVEDEKKAIAQEVMRQTGMNLQFSTMCLEQNNWALEAAIANFAEIRSQIPPDAFVQQ
jgi:nuclear RNA export factor